MCYKGGPRCAGEAKKRLLRAAKNMSNDQASMSAFFEARAEYDATSEGLQELRQKKHEAGAIYGYDSPSVKEYSGRHQRGVARREYLLKINGHIPEGAYVSKTTGKVVYPNPRDEENYASRNNVWHEDDNDTSPVPATYFLKPGESKIVDEILENKIRINGEEIFLSDSPREHVVIVNKKATRNRNGSINKRAYRGIIEAARKTLDHQWGAEYHPSQHDISFNVAENVQMVRFAKRGSLQTGGRSAVSVLDDGPSNHSERLGKMTIDRLREKPGGPVFYDNEIYIEKDGSLYITAGDMHETQKNIRITPHRTEKIENTLYDIEFINPRTYSITKRTVNLPASKLNETLNLNYER